MDHKTLFPVSGDGVFFLDILMKIKNSAKKPILYEISKLGWNPEILFPDLYGDWLKNNLNLS